MQVDADTIEGQYEDGGTQVAFTIEIDGEGKLTYTQEVPLEHSDDGSTATAHNDTNSPIDFGGLISATITVTDTDGDSVSASPISATPSPSLMTEPAAALTQTLSPKATRPSSPRSDRRAFERRLWSRWTGYNRRRRGRRYNLDIYQAVSVRPNHW